MGGHYPLTTAPQQLAVAPSHVAPTSIEVQAIAGERP
jgi:hypothetical protein